MRKLLSRLASLSLQYLLVVGFVLITTVTIAVGSLMTYGLIRNYLDDASDARVGRDMDLANAFYNNKLNDISSMAERVAAGRCVQQNLIPGSEGARTAIEILPANVLSWLGLEDQARIALIDAPKAEAMPGRTFFRSSFALNRPRPVVRSVRGWVYRLSSRSWNRTGERWR